MRTRDALALLIETCVICLLMPVFQSADATPLTSRPDNSPESGRSTHFIVRPDGSGDYPTIQAAIDASSEGGIVELTDGVFTGAGNQLLDIYHKAITLRSQSDDPTRCMIEASGNRFGGIYIQQGAAGPSLIRGITICNLNDSTPLSCEHSAPEIRNCVFEGNEAYVPVGSTGMYCTYSQPSFFGCVFRWNDNKHGEPAFYAHASRVLFVSCDFDHNLSTGCPCGSGSGAGVGHCNGGRGEFIDCTFTNNTGDLGGGLHCSQANLFLSGCLFDNNRAQCEDMFDTAPGALSAEEADSVSIESCVFTNNRSYGYTHSSTGGFACWQVPWVRVSNCTFAANTDPTGWSAAAAHLQDGWNVRFQACTFALNDSEHGSCLEFEGYCPAIMDRCLIVETTGGAAIECEGPNAVPELVCCDIFGNDGGDWTGLIASQLGLDGNIWADPLLCGSENPDQPFTLHPESPCAIQNNPECGQIGAWPIGCGNMQEVAGGAGAGADLPRLEVAALARLGQTITVSFEIPADLAHKDATVAVFSIDGRLIRTLWAGRCLAGRHFVEWDGQDRTGTTVSAGIYCCRLTSGTRGATARMALLP